MTDWGPAGAVCAVVIAGFSLLWKIRRDEIQDIKESMRETVVSTAALLRVEVTALQAELRSLRDWRHDFGQKEMVYDSFDRRILALEQRVTLLELSSPRNP